MESQRNYTSEEIKILEYKKDNVQNIQILKPPTNSPDPIKPKKKLIVISATMIGLFLMVFISFFLEYIFRKIDQDEKDGTLQKLAEKNQNYVNLETELYLVLLNPLSQVLQYPFFQFKESY